MPDDSRVDELLEELVKSGGTPEEVCRACPELLPQVRSGWQQLRAREAEIEGVPTSKFPADSPPVAPPSTDLPQIRGYEVQRVLGRGGMGVVYKAWHLRLNRAVAVKMLLAGAYARPEELERFLREAEAVAGLRHANIIQVHDVGDLDGRPYFTMEYVEGGSLAQQVTDTPQPARQAATLVAAVAEGIHVAHQSGIVHRDLKPANILLTADGTPKITDFGLARRSEQGALTVTGAPMGTPGYMAPEQAEGRKDAIGPGVDVYALGAILYELLTGRPPFRGETAAATLQQVLTEDPVPPSRWNARIPRDLETICLKCLHKEPQQRYPSAAALAEDLHRFERGEPIAARRLGPLERGVRWLRRRPSLAAALAASVLLALVLIGGGLWLHRQQTLTVQAVEAELREVSRLCQHSAYPEARVALERAKARLGDGGPARMHALLEQTGRDLQLLPRLDAIRVSRSTYAEGRFNHAADRRFNNAEADRDYEAAFRDAGLCKPADEPDSVAARVQASVGYAILVAALDDWAVCATDKVRREWLLMVARRADPDSWRDRVRDPAAWEDGAALAKLAQTAPVAEQPVRLLLAVGERLQAAGEDGLPLLRRVQEQHPDDFWSNFTLANTLYGVGKQGKGDPAHAAGYYRQALKLRPKAAAVPNNLGLVLFAKFWLEDNAQDWGWGRGAISFYRDALRIDPEFAPAHNNLGLALKVRGHGWDEATAELQAALRINPRLAPAQVNLGEIEALSGRLNKAIDLFRQALSIDPDIARARYNLGLALLAKGRLDEADDCFPEGVRPLDKLRGEALNEALDHYKGAYTFAPKWVPSRNMLRIPPSEAAQLNEAIDHYRQAIRLEPDLALAHGALGQALLAKRDFAEATAATRRSLDLLTQEQQYLRANLEAQLQRCGHLLVLEGRLPAIVQGTDRPAVGDCLDLAELCFVKTHYAAAARLYAEALAVTPRLTEDLRAGHRFNAARAAALAGCGRGDDVAALKEPELMALRKQARAWLRLDLAAWTAKLDHGTAADRIRAQKTLPAWRDDPDLAGLRDRAGLDKLPPAERQECRALWSDFDALLGRVQTAK